MVESSSQILKVEEIYKEKDRVTNVLFAHAALLS
jgi:hypothetical protein